MQREEEVVVAEVALLLVLVAEALRGVVARADQLEALWCQSQAVMEESLVVLQDPGCACVCLVMLVLQWDYGCAVDNVGRCTIR